MERTSTVTFRLPLKHEEGSYWRNSKAETLRLWGASRTFAQAFPDIDDAVPRSHEGGSCAQIVAAFGPQSNLGHELNKKDPPCGGPRRARGQRACGEVRSAFTEAS